MRMTRTSAAAEQRDAPDEAAMVTEGAASQVISVFYRHLQDEHGDVAGGYVTELIAVRVTCGC